VIWNGDTALVFTACLWPSQPEVDVHTQGVEAVGEPCAGKSHARFDGGWLETGPRLPRQPPTLPTGAVNRPGFDGDSIYWDAAFMSGWVR